MSVEFLAESQNFSLGTLLICAQNFPNSKRKTVNRSSPETPRSTMFTPTVDPLFNKFPPTSHKSNSSGNNVLNNSDLLLRPRRINNQILLRHQRSSKRHSLSPLLRNNLLAIRRTDAEMKGVVTTANSRMDVSDLPLRLLGNAVRCCDVIGEQESVAGLFED